MAPRFLAFIALVLLQLATLMPAEAATSIAYSADGNAYGWCAGYASGRAGSCALDQCTSSGGKACQQVLACSDGWGAVAFAEDPAVGFAADCGIADAWTARDQALGACVVASNAVCWTDSTFDRNGNEQSKQSNYDTDLTWYAQSLLQLDGFTKSPTDGVFGPATRDALGKFQTALGRTPTGTIDDETIRRLLDAEEGTTRFAAAIKRDIVDKERSAFIGRIYSQAASPNPSLSFTEDLAKRPVADARLALATFLAADGNKCTLPATSVTLLGEASSNSWDIECAEANYTLIISADGGTVTMSSPKSAKPADQQPTSPTPSKLVTPAPTDTKPADATTPTTTPADQPGARDLTNHHN